jgi:diacylglycerol O-acyltransferase-1
MAPPPESSTATSIDATNGSVTRRNAAPKGEPDLTSVEPANGTTKERLQRTPQKKYRHVAAVHSQTRPSCLSHDSPAAPSFLGFRNLMVIVLGRKHLNW